jgi:hypothetical protein
MDYEQVILLYSKTPWLVNLPRRLIIYVRLPFTSFPVFVYPHNFNIIIRLNSDFLTCSTLSHGSVVDRENFGQTIERICVVVKNGQCVEFGRMHDWTTVATYVQCENV